MSSANTHHKKIIADSQQFTEDLHRLCYEKSDEKQVLREKLQHYLDRKHFKHAIDLGAGPGFVANILDEHASKLTLLDITPEYESILKEKYPQAEVKIKSLLDVDLSVGYDLILLSHVLYYISEEIWFDLINQLYQQLPAGGMLIVCHGACDKIRDIFSKTKVNAGNVAYRPTKEINAMMQKVGPHIKDYYLSNSQYPGPINEETAKNFLQAFYGLENPNIVYEYPNELNEFMRLFKNQEDSTVFVFHSDVYVFEKQ